MKFEDVLKASDKNLDKMLRNWLGKKGYSVLAKKGQYIYGKGDIPILVVAHLDTVHNPKPTNIFYDQNKSVYWSPEGLGADDRAGVWGIIQLIYRGLRPHILFCHQEETGGVGARAAARDLKPDIRYVIELDRKGSNDSVFYSLDSIEFEDYINEFGFKTDYGSFSDISILCPAWGIAGVNLSIGYYKQHSKQEYLNYKELLTTIDRVELMLRTPPSATFKYIESYKYKSSYGAWKSKYSVDYADEYEYGKCASCGSMDYLEGVEGHLLCYDCMEMLNTCSWCGVLSNTVIVTKEGDVLCLDCASDTHYICTECEEAFEYSDVSPMEFVCNKCFNEAGL